MPGGSNSPLRNPRTFSPNDPNLFLVSNVYGDFNDNSIDGSGYGALPAAEQNQTYIAYFDGVGGTGPEIIGQTAYFIKYLIDEEGNVTNPEPGNVGLVNLMDNFEVGKRAVVNAHFDSSITLGNLVGGPFNITGIGRISPILITETGSSLGGHITTMSFNSINKYDVIGTPEFGFKATKNTTQNILYSDPETKITATSVINANDQYDGTNSVYTFVSNSFDYSNRVKFLVSGKVSAGFTNSTTLQPIGSTITVSLRVKKNSSILTSLDLTFTRASSQQYYTLPFNIDTGYLNFAIGDTVELAADSFIPQIQGNDFKILAEDFSFSAINEYPANTATASASWWSIGTYLTGSNVSVLTSSADLYKWYGPDYIQVASQSIYDFGFSQITLPFEVIPGDFIRFEYNSDKVFNITNVETSDRLYLTVTPPIPTGSVLDHFVLYRLVNDGTYVILDVNKTSAGSFSGILQPEYISEDLKNKYSNIVQKLTLEGIIT